MDTPAVSRAYLSRKLTRPLPTKDGGTLRTVLDARAYMLRLSKDRERSARWQRAAQLLLAKADVGAVSRQLELALLYDGKLDGMKTLTKFTHRDGRFTERKKKAPAHVWG
jgi:hypothetical protein